jgi:hypothetical protein
MKGDDHLTFHRLSKQVWNSAREIKAMLSFMNSMDNGVDYFQQGIGILNKAPFGRITERRGLKR